jgi:cytochrome c oxidase cbb3-type subunit 1
MTVVWGIVGMLVGVFIAAQLVWPDLNFGQVLAVVWSLAPTAYQRCYFCFWRLCTFCHIILCCATHLSGTTDFRHTGFYCFLGLAAGYCARPLITLPLGLYLRQGIRRTGMAYRHPDHDCLGAVRDCFFRYDHETPHVAYLCCQLVFCRLHHHRCGLHIINSMAIPVTLFKSYSVYAGAVDAMVQWWYGHNAVGFFPHCRFSRHHVLLRAKTSRSPGVFLPFVYRALLGIDRHLHLGRPTPPALHRVA